MRGTTILFPGAPAAALFRDMEMIWWLEQAERAPYRGEEKLNSPASSLLPQTHQYFFASSPPLPSGCGLGKRRLVR